ncbi:hypothetical protein KPH14_001862 [Odynerus spinipes]|uniref:EGF-like domain-containing protein n=1 Tax=Odynerus spinipes TaxID=1348599 RepID=A0AAD9S071_9HYME|nr:hypothetical protein KPH14_001862 [Odynerus spinipes]
MHGLRADHNMGGGLGTSRWLEAIWEPSAKIHTLPGGLDMLDVTGDGEARLVSTDLGSVNANSAKIRVYKGSDQITEHNMVDAPCGVAGFYTENGEPRSAVLAAAAGSSVYIFKNMRPFFKYCLPHLEAHPKEREIWHKAGLEEEPNVMTLADDLDSLLKELGASTISPRTLKFLSMDTNLRVSFVEQYRRIPLVKNNAVTALGVIRRDSWNDPACSCLIVGTENGEILVLDPRAFTVMDKHLPKWPPVAFATTGLWAGDGRIIVIGRDGNIGTIRRGSPVKLWEKLGAPAVAISVLTGDGAAVAVMDGTLIGFSKKGVRLWSINVPGIIMDMVSLPVPQSGLALLAVSTAGFGVRIYDGKHHVDTIKTMEPVSAIKYGRMGQEERTMAMVTVSGGLCVKILKRTADFSIRNAVSMAAPFSGGAKFAIPKKTRLFVEQTIRERSEAKKIHNAFQQGFLRLRLIAAKSAVDLLTDCENTGTDPISLEANVLGLGPNYRIQVLITNISDGLSDTGLFIVSREENIEVNPRVVNLPLLPSGIPIPITIDAMLKTRISGRVQILLCKKGKSKPLTQRFFYFRFHCIFLLLFLPGTLCIIPEASQESILQPFKSYSDIAMFHFNVPKEVLRATWQFSAFMDEQNCPQRKVHIHLRQGSYPILPTDNMTFPPNMYPLNNDTIIISTITYFEPKSVAVIPVYGPQAGDWFVAAYLSHWDKKVQQEGLVHTCHYSIGSIALWVQANAIENVPIGYQTTLNTKETSSYYKIYVPSGISTLYVYIWGCNFTVHSFRNVHEPCIKNIALQGRVLPIHNNTHPSNVGNLTMLDSYTFTIPSPYEDSYYYLLVISDSIIEFNIKVSIAECPIKLIEKQFIRQYLDISSFSEKLTQVSTKDLKQLHTYNWSSNRSSSYDVINLYKNQFYIWKVKNSDNFDPEDKCFPRYKLVRVKHSEVFSGTYLLQGREWLTPWLVLMDSYPIIVQFDILPLVDIGGTLDIKIHLEMYKSLAKQLVIVEICVQKGHVPNILDNKMVCEDERLSMNLSSSDKHDESILIPYPQPDTWYIFLQATCYIKNHPVNCEMEEILVSLNIHTRQCVFPGNYSCGYYGICQEIHRGLLAYTACDCFEGYKGWGCTNVVSPNSRTYAIITTLMLTLSNGFFIPAIYLAIKRELYTEGLIYLSTMLSSALYHACDQRVTNYCITKFEVLQYCDFFSSILAFWVTLVAMAELPIRFVPLCHMSGVLIIAFGVQVDRRSLFSILMPLTIGIMIPIGRYIYHSYNLRSWKRPARLSKLLLGLLMVGVGLLLFSLVETEANYQYVHSAWHVIIAISLLFLLPPVREGQLSNSDTKSSNEDSELLNYKDYHDSPVFTVISGQESLVIVPR